MLVEEVTVVDSLQPREFNSIPHMVLIGHLLVMRGCPQHTTHGAHCSPSLQISWLISTQTLCLNYFDLC